MIIYLSHFILACFLVFISGKLGRKCHSSGYEELSVFETNNNKMEFNFLYRVLVPMVYLIIVSTVLYQLKLDKYVVNIYSVPIVFTILRWLIIFSYGRVRLVNWTVEFTYSTLIIILSYYLYIGFIKEKGNLLPDFATLKDELWLLIIIFIYKIFSDVSISYKANPSRYIDDKFKIFHRKYHPQITSLTTDKKIWSIIYSIMIYEDFNRPKLVRFFEYYLFLIKKPMTLGLMQIKTTERINDLESVRLASTKIKESYEEISVEHERARDSQPEIYHDFEDQIVREVAYKYNPSTDYSYEIANIAKEIENKYFI